MTLAKNRLLFEDDHLLIVNKLSGELSVRGSGKLQKLPLLDFLKKEYPGIRPLNRLDYETSGIVVFAKTSQAFATAREGMHTWEKTYKTLLKGYLKYPKSVISLPLPARSSAEKVPASTRYRVCNTALGISYVEATIRTGRHHQIRRHFAAIHHPLVLDDEYGDKKFNTAFAREFHMKKFFLHAERVTLTHPIIGEKMEVVAALPKTFENVVEAIFG